MTASRLLLAPALVLGLGLAAGCGGGGGTERATNAGSTTRPGPSSTSTSAPQPDTAPAEAPPAASPAPSPSATAEAPTAEPSDNAYAARCKARGTLRADLERVDPRTRLVEGERSRLAATVAGDGSTALLVLDGTGDACAATELIASAGADDRFRVVAADLCSSPVAACVGELVLDEVAQTGVLVDWIHETYDVEKVVLLGVGEGGEVAVRAAGAGLATDSVVNVSGAAPAAAIRRASVPMLHVHEDLGSIEAAGARKAAAEGVRRVTLTEAASTGWAALLDGADLTGTGREALDFAGR